GRCDMPAESLRASTRPMAPRPATATRVIGIGGPWAWRELRQLASYAARSSVTSPCERCVKPRLDHDLAEGQILRAMREEPNAQEFIRRGVRNPACAPQHSACPGLSRPAADPAPS